MKARLMTAALDWNGQVRTDAVNREGNAAVDTIYSKRGKKHAPRKRYNVQKTHTKKLLSRMMQVKRDCIKLPPIKKPKDLKSIAPIPKPQNMEICSRF